MLAFSVREALRQAAAAFGPAGVSVDLASPATPEAVFWALDAARSQHTEGSVEEGAPGHTPPQPDGNGHPYRPVSERVQDTLSHTGGGRG
jgi:xanthine dehydrogenase large subunit